jgi:hypothetical protein
VLRPRLSSGRLPSKARLHHGGDRDPVPSGDEYAGGRTRAPDRGDPPAGGGGPALRMVSATLRHQGFSCRDGSSSLTPQGIRLGAQRLSRPY